MTAHEPDCTQVPCPVSSETATGDEPVFNGSWWIYHGLVGAYMQITSMTPVPYHIPSFIPQPPKNV